MNKLFRILRRSVKPDQSGETSHEAPAEAPAAGPGAGTPAASPDRTLFIGHTRFSVHQHGSGYFNATRGADLGAGFSEEEYTRWLYSETRLAPRTEIFTTLSLPQLELAARHHDVVHFVSYSPSLPEHHKAELRAAAERHSFLRLNETTKPVNSTPSRALVNKALAERSHGSRPFGVYRLDDDDLLSVGYFDQMATYVTPRHIGWWVSLGTGFSAIRMDGKYAYTRELYYPKSAFGPMAVAAKNEDGEILNLSAPKHTVMDKFNPTILDSRAPAYFHIRHESQDSTVKGSVAPFYPEAMSRILGEGPADLNQVSELFPVLSGLASHEPGPAERSVQLSTGSVTISREPVTFEWPHEGPLALVLTPSGDAVLKANQVQVRLTVAVDGGAEIDAAASKFFTQAKLRHSDRDGTFWSYMPHKPSGFGHVLPIEPPQGLHVTEITVVTGKPEEVQMESIVAYPLPVRKS